MFLGGLIFSKAKQRRNGFGTERRWIEGRLGGVERRETAILKKEKYIVTYP